MNKKMIIILIGIFITLIIGGVLFFSSKDTDEQNTPIGKVSSIDLGIANKDFIPVTHTYIDGTHTFSGKIILPTPCHQLFSNVRIAESFPEQVAVDFITSNGAKTCAQVVTPESFTVTFQASENAVVRMTLNEKEMVYRIVSETGSMVLPTEIKDSVGSSTLKSDAGTTTKKGR
jgi:hypothetical protein